MFLFQLLLAGSTVESSESFLLLFSFVICRLPQEISQEKERKAATSVACLVLFRRNSIRIWLIQDSREGVKGSIFTGKMGGCCCKSEVSEQEINGYAGLRQQNRQPDEEPAYRPKPVPDMRHEAAPVVKPLSPLAPPPLKVVHAADTILGKPYEDVRSLYTLGKELGRGQFGVTHLCVEIATCHSYACKSISKRKLLNKNDKEDIKREIQIMQHLSGQTSIVEFKGAYEDKHSVHLVMELCAGGELFDRIIAKGFYSERAAASIFREIVNVVHICHFMGVMHRDLKPENFLLSSKEEKAALKATDFGLSVFIEEGKAFSPYITSFSFLFKSFHLCKLS